MWFEDINTESIFRIIVETGILRSSQICKSKVPDKKTKFKVITKRVWLWKQ